MPSELHASWLGRVDYLAAWRLQEAVAARVGSGAPERLLLLEHDPVYTIGRRGSLDHLTASLPELRAAGASVYRVDRGGDITYHGPGQLVGYPVLDLLHLEMTIPQYIELLERSLIEYLAGLGIDSEPGEPGFTGVWRDGEKLAAIGIKLNRSVVSHGFALNLTTDLAYFEGIVPCGHAERRPTSVEAVTGRRIDTRTAAKAYAGNFAATFGVELDWVPDLRGTAVRN